jgi:prephenate dehydrogenase
MNRKAIILGVNGKLGGLFTKLLSKENVEIIGIDQSPNAKFDCYKYIEWDLSKPYNGLDLIIEQSDYLIICLPAKATFNFFNNYDCQIFQQILILDTLSIKSKISDIYLEKKLSALSINPMFGPDLELVGRNMIVCNYANIADSEWLISLFSNRGVKVTFLSASEHDKITSIVQAATHLSIMTFGLTLSKFGIDVSKQLDVSTPLFYSLYAIYSRIISGNSDVYWEIQTENPYADAARSALIDSLLFIDNTIKNNNENSFSDLFDRDKLTRINEFSSYCSNIFELARISSNANV